MLTREEIIEKEHEFIYQTYKRLPIVVDYAVGSRIYDYNGDCYLDFLGGIAVNALGYSHPAILKAMREQMDKYLHISNYFYQEPQIILAEKLCQISGFDKVFFTNSGTEATDGAMKLVRKWGQLNKKSEIFAFTGGFHGRTYGALSIMDKPLYKDNMGPFLDKTKVMKLNDIPSLYENINSDTAAVFLEFIQGEGGISEPDRDFLDVLLELKGHYHFLLIADEVQAGTGRSGKFFSYEHHNVVPDMVTMAKGMGGGLPLGCILFSKELADIWTKGSHGTTYGGNALACVTGKVVIDELENGLLEQVIENGNYLQSKLIEIKDKYSSKVIQIRGKGLMQGLLLNFDAQALVDELIKQKIITNAASGSVLRLVPPLIVDKDDIDEFIEKLDLALNNVG
jgi:predicted acetylornithine/succinylornithine family transaminase